MLSGLTQNMTLQNSVTNCGHSEDSDRSDTPEILGHNSSRSSVMNATVAFTVLFVLLDVYSYIVHSTQMIYVTFLEDGTTGIF